MNKPKLLLHCCCAPCSSAIIEHLHNYYDITLYFYNPNITSENEYVARAEELVRLVDCMNLENVNVQIENYNSKPFHEIADGYKDNHEGGTRCRGCYAHRLRQTADYAIENGFTQFSTTLTISPYKDSAVINSIGTGITMNFQYKNLMYMPFDFGFLYTRSLELCKQYNLYQQDYCGCEYSKH